MKAFRYDISAGIKELSEQRAMQKDPVVKQILLLSQIELTMMSRPSSPASMTEALRNAVEEIPASSLLWSVSPVSILAIQRAALASPQPVGPTQELKQRVEAYIEEFLEKQPDTPSQSRSSVQYVDVCKVSE